MQLRFRHPLPSDPAGTRSLVRNRARTRLVLVLAVLGALDGWGAAAAPAGSPGPGGPWELGSIRLGVVVGGFDSEVGFAVGSHSSPLLDVEDTLGLPSSETAFRADALYRIDRARRHQVDFSYTGYRRSGNATLTDPIDLGGGVVIPAVGVRSVLNFDMIRVGYSYAFHQTDRWRVGGGLSAYVLPIEYGLRVVGGATPPAVETDSLTVPLPALAFRADVRVWRELYLTAGCDGVYLDLAGLRGMLVDGGVAAEYRFLRYCAVGVGYTGFTVNVSSTEQDPAYPGATSFGEIDVTLHGFHAFVKATF